MSGYSVSCFNWNSTEELFLLNPIFETRLQWFLLFTSGKWCYFWEKPRIPCFGNGQGVKGGELITTACVCYNIHYEAFTQGLDVISITRLVFLGIVWIYSVFLWGLKSVGQDKPWRRTWKICSFGCENRRVQNSIIGMHRILRKMFL